MERYSFIVGIDTYKDSQVSNLRCAVNDATELNASFATPGKYQIPKENQIILCDEEATRTNIVENLNKLSSKIKENDLFIFYFAGHGCSDNSQSNGDSLRKYIVPYDVDVDNLDSTAIDFLFLGDRFEAITSKRMLMIFDCCHSGSAGGRTFQISGKRNFQPFVTTEYLEKVSGEGRVILAACSGKEVAKEDLESGHGLFTKYILKGLKGKADYKKDGHIDLEELWMYVQEETCRASDRCQKPVRRGEIEGDPIYLSEPIETNLSDEEKAHYVNKIIDRFKDNRLQEVRIANSDDKTDLGTEAAKYLAQNLRNNTKIALSCGRTLIETISKLPRLNISNVEIFPLNGSPSDEVHLTDSMVLSYLLWSKFDSDKAICKIVPTGIPEKLFKTVQDDIGKLANNVLTDAKDADIFLFGIGSPSTKNDNIPHLLQLAGLSAEDLKNVGVIGEINFHVFDEDGKFLALEPETTKECKEIVGKYSSKFYSLSPADFVEVTKRPGVDIVAVSGGSDKREAIAAAIRGKLIRTLITDVNTAIWLANA